MMFNYRTSSAINQIKDGMNDVGGMWDLIRDNSTLFCPLFCQVQSPLRKEDMDNITHYNFSEVGSNAKKLEDESVYAWEVFLQEVEGLFGYPLLHKHISSNEVEDAQLKLIEHFNKPLFGNHNVKTCLHVKYLIHLNPFRH